MSRRQPRRPLRLRVAGTQNVVMRRSAAARTAGTGSVSVLGGFALVIGVGTVFLTLPFASESRTWTHAYDAFFTAVSAVCVTGLVVFDTESHWSFAGEAAIATLIVMGGLGYMMGTSVLFWALGRRFGLRDTYMLRLYYGAPTLGETFRFARRIAAYAAVVQATGAIALYVALVASGEGFRDAIWMAVFHAVSAFNNAGFNVTGNDLISYAENPAILLIVSALVIFGGIGAVPVFAVIERRSFRKLPLDAKLILATTGTLLAVGTALLLAWEWTNKDTLGGVAVADRPVLAFFQAAVPRTAGFSAIDIVHLRDESKFFLMPLMLIGGAAGSTAGGIKVGVFSLLFFAIIAVMRGRTDVMAFGRLVPTPVILRALAVALLGVAVAFGICLALLTATDFRDIDVLFESLSAVGTVGLSTGVTQGANDAGRAILILGMLLGRFGPLLLVLEMARRPSTTLYKVPEDSIRLG
jgi:trk system potassium uptake protein TrkH